MKVLDWIAKVIVFVVIAGLMLGLVALFVYATIMSFLSGFWMGMIPVGMLIFAGSSFWLYYREERSRRVR